MPEVVRAIGALAGLGAVAGLGVLSVLYGLHARDVRRLREWAGGAPERSSRAPSPKRSIPRRVRIPARDVALVLVCLLVLAGVGAYGVAALTGDDADGESHRASSSGARGAGPAVKPQEVTVAVLNATSVPGLAAALSGRLAAASFVPGRIDDYPDKQRAGSVVQYTAGHEAAARAVGRSLGISRLAPISAGSRALSGDATVIVVAGADQAP